MNTIKVIVDFERRNIQKKGISLVSGDYNSTKIIFEFNKEYEGLKVFELADSSGTAIFVENIPDNNELILVGYNDDNEEVSIFNEAGEYPFEISLYGENSKLTSAHSSLKVKAEKVKIGDKVVESYLPIFDNLMNEIAEAIKKLEDAGAGILEEVDPTVPEHVKNIKEQDIKNWNSKASILDMTNYIEEHKDELKGDTGPQGEAGPRGEQGIQGEQGLKGDKGDKGDAGPQGEPGKDGINGTNGIDGKDGANGKDGENGQDGYTPVKGTDYFTEADKEEMVNLVLEALPSSEEVEY